MDWFRHSVDTFRAAWSGLPASYRVLAGILFILLALVVVWGMGASGRDGLVKIVDGASTVSERAEIISKLRELGIRPKVDGDSIYVPGAQADEAMLQLHGSGVLGDDAVFRFLKETSLFGTREQFDRQWLVAVQSRLASMIQRMDFVREARVQIAEQSEAKRRGWATGQDAAAAVVLTLKPGQQMTAARVRGIASLVAAAVPGLKASGVKILDQSGRFFRVPDTDMLLSVDLRDQEIAMASLLEEKALRVLPPDSRVSAQVRLSAEDRQIERKTIERGTTEEKTRKVRTLEEERGAEGGPAKKKEMTEEEAEHATGHTLEQRKSAAGSIIESLSIAVVIPDDAPGVPSGEGQRADFTRSHTALVRAATGAQEKDTIWIQIAPLSMTRAIGAAPPAPEEPVSLLRTQGPTLLLLLLGFAVLVAVYRLVRGMSPGSDGGDGGVVAEESLRTPGETILSAQDEVLDRVRDGVRESVAKNPKEAADVARRWMTP
ncbi:MAG TPA: hypothetical protein VGK61_01125 [Planctomycetota bacterium]|jgi:flagellar biosynthesis/type III secretory pathway M-ring protein FliF/YscJ